MPIGGIWDDAIILHYWDCINANATKERQQHFHIVQVALDLFCVNFIRALDNLFPTIHLMLSFFKDCYH